MCVAGALTHLPNGQIGQLGRDVHAFAGEGVLKRYFPGVQLNAPIRVAAPGPVFHVATDGAAHGRQLRANLVVATADGYDFQQPVALGLAHQLVVQLRFGCSGLRIGVQDALVAGFGFADVVHQFARLGGWRGLHQRHVYLVYQLLPELLCEVGHGLGGGGQQHHTAHRTVYAVHQVHGFIGMLVCPIEQGFVASRIGLHGHTGRLVEHQQVLVLKKNFGRHGSKMRRVWQN